MNITDTDYVLMIARNDRFCHVGRADSLQVHRHQQPPMFTVEFFDAAGRRLKPIFDAVPEDDHHHTHEGTAADSFKILPDPPVDPEALRLRVSHVLDIARAHVAADPMSYQTIDGETLTVPEVQPTLRATMVALARDMELAGDEPSRHRAGMLHNLMHGIVG
jgi:hypothetical protein